MTKVAWLLLTQHSVRLNLYTNDEFWYLEQFAKSWGTHTLTLGKRLEVEPSTWMLSNLKKDRMSTQPKPLIKISLS